MALTRAVDVLWSYVKITWKWALRLVTAVFCLPKRMWTNCRQPNTGERQIDAVARWITFITTICLGCLGLAFTILEYSHNHKDDEHACEAIKVSKQANQLAIAQDCKSGVCVSLSSRENLITDYRQQNLLQADQRYCERHATDMSFDNIMPDPEWISSGVAELWNKVGFKLTAGWCGLSTQLDDYGNTCISISILFLGIWLYQIQHAQLSLLGGLMSLASVLYTIVQAVGFFIVPLHVDWIQERPLWREDIIKYVLGFTGFSALVALLECCVSKSIDPTVPLSHPLQRTASRLVRGPIHSVFMFILMSLGQQHSQNYPLVLCGCSLYGVIALALTNKVCMEAIESYRLLDKVWKSREHRGDARFDSSND